MGVYTVIYAAVVARASPIISISVVLNNENKIHHLFSANVCPEFENPDNLKHNKGKTYG